MTLVTIQRQTASCSTCDKAIKQQPMPAIGTEPTSRRICLPVGSQEVTQISQIHRYSQQPHLRNPRYARHGFRSVGELAEHVGDTDAIVSTAQLGGVAREYNFPNHPVQRLYWNFKVSVALLQLPI
jgi:hypothetical protein